MNKKCLICDIIDGKREVRIVRSSSDIIVYRSPAPLAPVHLVIAPKKHIPSLTAITPGDAEVISRIFLLAPELARENAIFQCGFRLVSNCGPDADTGDEIPHLHFHFLGGTRLTSHLA